MNGIILSCLEIKKAGKDIYIVTVYNDNNEKLYSFGADLSVLERASKLLKCYVRGEREDQDRSVLASRMETLKRYRLSVLGDEEGGER